VAARRPASRGASRGRQGTPGWMWLLTGILIGLGLAWYLFAKGYIPQPRGEAAQTVEPAPGEASGAEEVAPGGKDSKRPQYDFFTVLPEMEVVVPEQELSARARPEADAAGSAAQGADTGDGAASGPSYVLQVGSFRAASDADQLKARLALLGVVAQVQTVTVNDATWHRVRVGPLSGARQADEMRSRLADNDIDSLVMKTGSE
jgi:cell division protein FtsN